MDEIVDADTDTNNGITVEGDLFLADNSTAQLATVQGVSGAAIDFIDDINFDTSSGIKFGAGTKLDDCQEGTFTATYTGAFTGTDTWKFVKVGKQVTLSYPTRTHATTAGHYIMFTGVPTAI